MSGKSLHIRRHGIAPPNSVISEYQKPSRMSVMGGKRTLELTDWSAESDSIKSPSLLLDVLHM